MPSSLLSVRFRRALLVVVVDASPIQLVNALAAIFDAIAAVGAGDFDVEFPGNFVGEGLKRSLCTFMPNMLYSP